MFAVILVLFRYVLICWCLCGVVCGLGWVGVCLLCWCVWLCLIVIALYCVVVVSLLCLVLFVLDDDLLLDLAVTW